MNVELTKKMWIVLTGLIISFVYKTDKITQNIGITEIISNWNIEITENNKLRPLDGPYDFFGVYWVMPMPFTQCFFGNQYGPLHKCGNLAFNVQILLLYIYIYFAKMFLLFKIC